jgi:hypothetical protein
LKDVNVAETKRNFNSSRIEVEVNRILKCIDSKSDHYQILNVDRNASIETIRKAYCRAVDILHPLKCKEITEADGALRWKLSQVFLRIVEAFSAISHPGRRAQYDSEINRRRIVPLPLPPLPYYLQKGNESVSNPVKRATGPLSAGAATFVPENELRGPGGRDRRRSSRLVLSVPVRVTSLDASWREVAESRDVSRTGILLHLRHEVEAGSHLKLEIPMPLVLRNHSHDEALYTVTAIVRYARPASSGGYLVGIEFDPASN